MENSQAEPKEIAGERIWAEIDIRRIRENIRLIKEFSRAKKLLLAVKADAYGHGAKEIAPFLQRDCDFFGVASVEEGISLRENGVTKSEILILSPIPYSSIPPLFQYHLIPTISEKSFLRLLIRETERRKRRISVFLEIDTGMGRTGFLPEEARKVIPEILNNPFLDLKGIFSHFSSSDSDFSFTKNQISLFKENIKGITKRGVLFSLANSSGIINFPDSHLQLIRPGLLAYGIIPNTFKSVPEAVLTLLRRIQPALSLYSRVVGLRNLPKGSGVSYGRRFICEKDSLIAVVSCGYGDGIPYNLTNRGEVLLNGKRAKMVGAVCMDLLMVDVSEIEGVRIGNRVTLIGEEGKERIRVSDVAFWANTIPYEITCRISPRVRRVFKEGKRIIKIR
uniref:Alanine racemase n=1 Tax=candidate division WOR-3 bacterium TaxID=2052148 RepID=A0A7C3YTL4_UNCW3